MRRQEATISPPSNISAESIQNQDHVPFGAPQDEHDSIGDDRQGISAQRPSPYGPGRSLEISLQQRNMDLYCKVSELLQELRVHKGGAAPASAQPDQLEPLVGENQASLSKIIALCDNQSQQIDGLDQELRHFRSTLDYMKEQPPQLPHEYEASLHKAERLEKQINDLAATINEWIDNGRKLKETTAYDLMLLSPHDILKFNSKRQTAIQDMLRLIKEPSNLSGCSPILKSLYKLVGEFLSQSEKLGNHIDICFKSRYSIEQSQRGAFKILQAWDDWLAGEEKQARFSVADAQNILKCLESGKSWDDNEVLTDETFPTVLPTDRESLSVVPSDFRNFMPGKNAEKYVQILRAITSAKEVSVQLGDENRDLKDKLQAFSSQREKKAHGFGQEFEARCLEMRGDEDVNGAQQKAVGVTIERAFLVQTAKSLGQSIGKMLEGGGGEVANTALREKEGPREKNIKELNDYLSKLNRMAQAARFPKMKDISGRESAIAAHQPNRMSDQVVEEPTRSSSTQSREAPLGKNGAQVINSVTRDVVAAVEDMVATNTGSLTENTVIETLCYVPGDGGSSTLPATYRASSHQADKVDRERQNRRRQSLAKQLK